MVSVLFVSRHRSQETETFRFLIELMTEANCESAPSQRDAIARLRSASFDLFVADFRELSGVQNDLIKIVTDQFPEVPVVIISSHPRLQLVPDGPRIILVPPEYLLDTIENLLRRAPRRNYHRRVEVMCLPFHATDSRPYQRKLGHPQREKTSRN